MDETWGKDLAVYETEDELVEGLRRRDHLACNCLLKRYMPRLYRLAVQITGSSDEAEDVLQESFIQACGRFDSFEARGGSTASSLAAWLRRIVVNSALGHLRKRKPGILSLDRRPAVDTDGNEQPAVPEPVAGRASDPGDRALTSELRQALDEAVMRLPDSLRSAFVLRDIEGLSTEEAAETLGIGESALKVRLHRARLALRESLAPYLER